MQGAKLIVFEGVDGAGTTTQAQRLSERLRALHVPVHATAEPSQGPIGSLLRQALAGRFVVRGTAGSVRAPSWTTMALLFAADRMDHLEGELEPNLSDGVNVVCDRYYHSSVAYQSVTGAGAAAVAWIKELNRYARKPDLTLVLEVPPEIAAQRRRARAQQVEIFDADDVQRALCAFYARLGEHFPGERVVPVDATGSVDEVAERVWAQARGLFGL